MLPILHLNGYKIANPCFLARIPKDELTKFFEGMGYKPYFVEGHDPALVHQELAATLDTIIPEIRRIQSDARTKGILKRPAWPMIIFRTPKGWTCPPFIDGKKCEDYWRSHQVPMGDMDKPEHIAILEKWMKSYKAGELFDGAGPVQTGAGGAGAQGPPPDERQPARQRRAFAPRPEDAGLPRLRRRGGEPRRDHRRVRAAHGQVPAL